MSKDWYLMNSYPIYNSGMEQDEFNAYVVDGFEENLDTSPISIEVVVYNSGYSNEPDIIKAIIQNNTSDSSNTTNIRQIIGKQGTFKTGSYVKYQNKFWIIDSIVANNLIYDKALMTVCNYTLNFLDVDNKPVFYPCYIENYTKYNSGTKVTGTTNQMELGATQMYIKLTFDAKTAVLDRKYNSGVLKNKNQRLLIDCGTVEPKAYEITMPDRVTAPGLLILTVTESSDLSFIDDNVELMIADYYSRIPSTSLPDPEVGQEVFAEIQYSGDPVLFLNSGFKKFTAIFRNGDGEIIDALSPVWKVVLINESFLQFIEIQIVDDYIRLRTSNPNMIGVPIRLDLSSEDGVTNTSIMLEVIILG